ncbi:MAG: c-type cytochrome [Candidatus Brocadiales bacterium]
MRSVLSVVMLSGLILYLFGTVGPVLSMSEGAETDTKKLFKTHCIPCHGEDGKGTDLGKGLGTPDFTNAEWQKTRPDARFVEQILNGSEKMFAFKDKLNMEEVQALVAHVRQFAQK